MRMQAINENPVDGIRSLKHRISWNISRVISGAYSLCPHETGCRVLMYHAVGSAALGDERGLFSVTAQLFGQHMSVLAENCKAYPVADYQGKAGDAGVAVTFDDGYRDNLYVAAPILEKYNLPFTIFVSTSFVQNKDQQFLSPEDIRTLGKHPLAEIGAHGHTHVPLTRCSDTQLKHELETSKHYLEDLLGQEVNMIAYPYGAVDERVRNAARSLGYSLGVCSYEGVNDRQRDSLLLKRTAILAMDTPQVFKQKLCGDWDWRKWKQHDPVIGSY